MISLTRNKKLFYLTVSVQRARKDATYPQGATEYMKALLKLEKEYRLVKNKRAELFAEEKLDLTKAFRTAVRLESAIKSMRESMSANGTEHGSVSAVKKKNSKSYYKNLQAIVRKVHPMRNYKTHVTVNVAKDSTL